MDDLIGLQRHKQCPSQGRGLLVNLGSPGLAWLARLPRAAFCAFCAFFAKIVRRRMHPLAAVARSVSAA
ncbi:hypothetical protein [Xanthomonas nasturtii]|uniref:hypothetical protein n=1 Tax=Xanthomonas nasturtii TaxID=1843581 RepID=UPI0020112C4C|nr:hypothetical protein [Xanthomonas nasturtii]